jgi:hypothetical protein
MPNGQVKKGLFENNKFKGATLVAPKLSSVLVREENFAATSDEYLSKPPDILSKQDDVLS